VQCESSPFHECVRHRLVAARQAAIAERDSREAVLILRSDPQADQRAPILAKEVDADEIQCLDEAPHPVDMC
jgi:hypothetical protein